MKRTLDLFKARRGHMHIDYPVFTRVNPCNDEQKQKLESQIMQPITAIFPNEYNLVSIANSGRILYGLPQDTLMMKTISKLADDIIAGKL